jgi:hypothetical protein
MRYQLNAISAYIDLVADVELTVAGT